MKVVSSSLKLEFSTIVKKKITFLPLPKVLYQNQCLKITVPHQTCRPTNIIKHDMYAKIKQNTCVGEQKFSLSQKIITVLLSYYAVV